MAEMPRGPAGFRPGQRVWTEFFDLRGTDRGLWSLVAACDEDGLVLVAAGRRAPPFRGHGGTEVTLLPDTGRRVHVAMWRGAGVAPDHTPYLQVSPPQLAPRVQRRRFFRVQADMAAFSLQWPAWHGRVVDLSTAGCRIRVQHGVAPAVHVALGLSLALPTSDVPVAFTGRVMRVEAVEGAEHIAVAFTRVAAKVESDLVRYVRLLQALDHACALRRDPPS